MEPKYLTVIVSAFVSEEEPDHRQIDNAKCGVGYSHAILPFRAAAGMNTNFMLNLAAEDAVQDAINKGLLPRPQSLTTDIQGPSEPVTYPTKSE